LFEAADTSEVSGNDRAVYDRVVYDDADCDAASY
jgi:hypothetical protein